MSLTPSPELCELIGSKQATLLLARFGSLEGIRHATLQELITIKGVGPSLARKLKAAFKIATEVGEQPAEPLLTPKRVAEYTASYFFDAFVEKVGVVLLNAKLLPITFEMVSSGTVTSVPIHPREIFYPAIMHHATSIVLVHNHPSGDVSPSAKDVEQTRRLYEAGKIMGITLRDHLIVSGKNYRSLRETTPIWS